jgi:hypothetical protein
VAFSPDRTRIVASSTREFGKPGEQLRPGEAIVWEPRPGPAVVELNGPTQGTLGVAFSPDSARVATGSSDKTVKVWDVKTGAILLDLKAFSSPVASLAFSPDGTRLVTGADTAATVWDAQTGTTLLELKGHPGYVRIVAFSPDGTRIVAGGSRKGGSSAEQGVATVWDAATGAALYELGGSMSFLDRVAFTPDGARIVTSERGGTEKVWDVQTGKELAGEPIPQTLRPGRISPDGRLFARTLMERIELISLKPDAEELDYRSIHTRPDVWRYRKGYEVARAANDRFAARFYLDRLLSLPAQRTTERFKERNALQADPRVIARTGFHHPALAKAPYDRGVLALLAVNGDRLAQRLVAQELLRDGKSRPAIPMLFWCMASRPTTSPPVEELLLAQAYLDLKQPDEAKRLYRAAAEWLDRPRESKEAVTMEPADDPRHNPFHWEAWHECDVFRAEVEKAMAMR